MRDERKPSYYHRDLKSIVTRIPQAFGGRGYMLENPAARFYRELRVDRIWEGTSEIQRWVISRGIFKRGAAPYLGWE